MSYTQSHLSWLDRQPSHDNGYPEFLSENSIEWLEKHVADFICACEINDHQPRMWEIVSHWTNLSDRPDDLRFSLNDAIYGVTYRALLAVAEPCWCMKDSLDSLAPNRTESRPRWLEYINN